MNSSVEPLEGNLVRLTVTIPAADVDRAISDAYTSVAGKVRVPGFRKGKAPRKVIDNYVGRAQVLADALEALTEKSYGDAIDEHDIRPIDNPDVGEMEGLVEHEDYTYTAEVQIRPEFELTGDWQNLKVSVEAPVVTDAEIDAQLDHLRERFASLEPVEDRGIQIGDFALISFVGLVDGQEYEGNVVDKYLYETGKGNMPLEFDQALVGAQVGDTVESAFPIPETSSNPEFIGKMATFDITVHEIKSKQLPALDDEFAANAGGFDTLDEARTEIRTKLEENKRAAYGREVERKAVEALTELATGEVPEPMVKRRRDALAREFFNNLQQRGISMSDYHDATGMDPEQITADLEKEALTRVREELALEAVFRAEGMEVSDADVDKELQDMVSGTERTVDEMREDWEKAGVMPVVRESIMQHKAAIWLLERVEIVNEAPAEAEAEAETDEASEKPKKARKSAKKNEEE